MTSLVVITHIDFWKGGAGHRARLASILQFIGRKVKVTVAYIGNYVPSDATNIRKIFPSLHLYHFHQPVHESLRAFFLNHHFDFALIEYIELSSILPLLHPSTTTILDTHDIVHDRVQSFRSQHIPYTGLKLSRKREFEIFNSFDYVLAIQKKDYSKITASLPSDRVLLVPHAATFQKRTVRDMVQRVGYVASDYPPNVDAIVWFLKHVWKRISGEFGFTLDIYGHVCDGIPSSLLSESDRVSLHGFVSSPDLAYENSDIIINPVRCGAGLKIKNIEALANGLPLVTTSHGANGLEDGAQACYLKADSASQFAASIVKLGTEPHYRKLISGNALAYALNNFSPERCYSGLLRLVGGNS